MSFPLNPDPQYRPQTLADLTAATGASTNYNDKFPNIDFPPVGSDASSLIPKLFGYLSGAYETEDVPPIPEVAGDTLAEIGDDGYFGPSLPRAGGLMPPFPPAKGAGRPGIGATDNTNYGQPTIKKNATPGSLIISYSVSHSTTLPTAYVVAETSQSNVLNPPQNIPWADEVFTHEITLPV